MSESWRQRAACRGLPTEWWFSLPATPEAAHAKTICDRCPVNDDCRAAGRGEEGLWGGQWRGPQRGTPAVIHDRLATARRVKRLRASGMLWRDIGERLGMSGRNAARLLAELPDLERSPPRKVRQQSAKTRWRTEEERARARGVARAMVAAGESWESIAGHLQVSQATARRYAADQ